ncbi:hypothetical protein JOD02_001195 [Caldicoprobacter guelmensis]|nr:hypothetical protein [Caldicoprobacter guelmensis]
MCKNSWLKLLKFLDSREYNNFEGLACGSIVGLLLVSFEKLCIEGMKMYVLIGDKQ